MSVIERLQRETKGRLRSSVSISSFQAVIRELLQNAMDAEATAISVKIDLGSLSVCVQDNGSGIACEDLELLGKRYYTSKQEPSEKSDLGDENRKTYGFRGEALASIADMCSALLIQSQAENEASFSFIGRKNSEDLRDVLLSFFQTDPHNSTTVVANRLFHNLPVRSKITKRQTSKEQLSNELKALAYELLHERPDTRLKVSFSQSGTFEPVISLSGFSTAKQLLCGLYGTFDIVEIQDSLGELSVWGCLGAKSMPRFLFFNRKPLSLSSSQVKDIADILKSAGRNVSSFVLHFSSEGVFSWPQILKFLRQTVDATFNSYTPRTSPRKPARSPKKQITSSFFAKDVSVSASDLRNGEFRVISQVEKKFILVTIGCVLYAVDQHACDERIRLEGFLCEYISSFVDGRTDLRVKCSKPIDLGATEQELAMLRDEQDRMRMFGIECDFENGTVTHLPRHVTNVDGNRLREQLLELEQPLSQPTGGWFSYVQQIPKIVLDAIASSACRSSIKFGDLLTPPEMNYLLSQLGNCQVPFQCAHGRPTIHPLSTHKLGNFSEDGEL